MQRYAVLLGICFLLPAVAAAQTSTIQKEVQKELDKAKEGAKPAMLSPQSMMIKALVNEALKNNPDIRVAESKVRDAETELSRTRMKVVADIIYLHAEIQAAETIFEYAKRQHERVVQLHKAGAVPESELRDVFLALEKAKTELFTKQAKLPYLLGQQRFATSFSFVYPKEAFWQFATVKMDTNQYSSTILYDRLDAAMTGKLRKALVTMIQQSGETPARDLIDHLSDKLKGINLHIRVKAWKKDSVKYQLTEPIPLGAFLQFIEDELGVVFVLREYGIVVIAADEQLPPNAVRVTEFWKHSKAAEPKSDTKEKK